VITSYPWCVFADKVFRCFSLSVRQSIRCDLDNLMKITILANVTWNAAMPDFSMNESKIIVKYGSWHFSLICFFYLRELIRWNQYEERKGMRQFFLRIIFLFFFFIGNRTIKRARKPQRKIWNIACAAFSSSIWKEQFSKTMIYCNTWHLCTSSFFMVAILLKIYQLFHCRW